MSIDTGDLIDICEQLSEPKRVAVADFARFLLAQEDDAAWDRTIADPSSRPKLDEFVRLALAEGSDPLNIAQL